MTYYSDPLGLEGEGGPLNKDGAPKSGKEGDYEVAKDDCGDFRLCVHDGTRWVEQPGQAYPSQEVHYTQENSEGSDWITPSLAFFDGFSNAVLTNHVLGVGRRDHIDMADRWGYENVRAAQWGQLAGDLTSLVLGAIETHVGATITIGAGGISMTGAGAVVGAPAAYGGIALATEGVGTFSVSAVNLSSSLTSLMNSNETASFPEEQSSQAHDGSGTGEAAKGGSKSFKGVTESFLKKNGIEDIHAFKAEWLGTNKNLKFFDVVKNTTTNELMIVRKETQEIIVNTNIVAK